MDLEERARLHDEAIERAHQLRQAAIAQAWDWLLGQAMLPLAGPERAARRLAQRLGRHQPAAPESPACPS
jgi:hypothetical protein